MLIGRDAELRTVVELLASRRPVLLVGAAGVGKTALLEAVADRCPGGAATGGGLATLGWLAYLPLRRALGETPRGEDSQAVAEYVATALAGRALLLDDVQWADRETSAVI